jgi:hypothetical protein
MTRGKKILLVVGFVGLAIGGYALVKFLTRNVWKGKYGNQINYIQYDTPPSEEPLED